MHERVLSSKKKLVDWLTKHLQTMVRNSFTLQAIRQRTKRNGELGYADEVDSDEELEKLVLPFGLVDVNSIIQLGGRKQEHFSSN